MAKMKQLVLDIIDSKEYDDSADVHDQQLTDTEKENAEVSTD